MAAAVVTSSFTVWYVVSNIDCRAVCEATAAVAAAVATTTTTNNDKQILD